MELLEDIIDELIEYDNGGSQEYSTADIATKCFELRKQIKEIESKAIMFDKYIASIKKFKSNHNIFNLAEIGAAAIKAFESGMSMVKFQFHEITLDITDHIELIKWSESEGDQ